MGSKEDTATDACTCWTSADLAKLGEDVKDCKIKEVGDIAKGLKACKDAFAKCRKFEDDATSTISACSKSTDKLKQKAAQLNTNKNKMTEAQQRSRRPLDQEESGPPLPPVTPSLNLSNNW